MALSTGVVAAALLVPSSSPGWACRATAAAAMAAAKEKTPAGPVCVRVGTRSEGWAWPDGHFIRWAKCKGVVPACLATGKGGEGWYGRGDLIAAASCKSGAGGDAPAPTPAPAPAPRPAPLEIR